MGLGLPIYGALIGFFCATISYALGGVTLLGAVLLYSSTGVLAVLLSAVMIALRPEKEPSRQIAVARFSHVGSPDNQTS